MNKFYIPGHVPQYFHPTDNRKAFTVNPYIIAFLLACLVVSPALAINDKQGITWRDQAKRGDRTAINRLYEAARHGDRVAQFYYGVLFEFGYGMSKNENRAAYWYGKSAEQGYEKSQHSLGWMYHKGLDVPENIDSAIYWYNKAATQGYTRSQLNLGNIYREKQDYTRAIELYRKAAAQNLAEAQYALGYMYEKGLGVTRSNGTAARWYQQAAAQNHDGAKQALARLRSAQSISNQADNKLMPDQEILDILAGHNTGGIQHSPKSKAITGKWRLTAVSPETDKIVYYIVNLHLKKDGRYLQDSAYDRPSDKPSHLNRGEGSWGIADDKFLALCSNRKTGSCTHCESLMGIGPYCLKLVDLAKNSIKLEDDNGMTYTYRRTP